MIDKPASKKKFGLDGQAFDREGMHMRMGAGWRLDAAIYCQNPFSHHRRLFRVFHLDRLPARWG